MRTKNIAWLQHKLAGLVTAVRGGAARSVRYAVNVRHRFPLVTRAEQAITTRWPEAISRLRSIVSNFVRTGYPKVRQAFFLATEGEIKRAADKMAEVLLEPATAGSGWFPTAVDNVVEVIDQIALKDSGSAEQVRALLRQALINTFPLSPSLSGALKLAYISNSPLPSPAANCVHIIKMCSALQGRGADTTLYAEGSLNSAPTARRALFRDFDVTTPFDYVRVAHGANSTETNVKKAIAASNDSSTHLITRSPKAAYFAAILGIDTLLELHAPPQGSTLRYVRDLSRLLEFRGLIVITQALCEEVIRCIPEVTNKIWVVPDAADEPKSVGRTFPLRHEPHANFHVGYAGHLYSGKGLELIIDIAAQLPDVAFHILGGDLDDVHHWEKRTGGSNIVFYGHRPHVEVPAFLKSVNVAIAPYQRKVFARGNTLDIGKWMSPLKIFEYMANAKPIVTSDVAVLREVLTEGQTALLVDPDNVGAWVSAIQMLRRDQELRERLGRAAKSDFEQRFTWSKRAERILELLVAKKKSAAQPLNPVSGEETTNAETKPSICWLYEDKLADWAYGINGQRIAAQLKRFDHFFGDSRVGSCDKIDLKLCFDILVHIKHRTKVPGLSIVRMGGPKPLMQISGGERRTLERTFADVAAVIALSPELEAFAADFHPNVFLIPNGLDLDAWHPKFLSRRPHRPFRAGLAASLKTSAQREVKGLTIAAAACEEAEVELLVVGRGANHIPHDRMLSDFYSEIDVLVHPVGPGKEGSSNVIMECLALGIPVITTIHAGYHAATLRDHVEAIFADRNSVAFAIALNELKQDHELRMRLSSEGRAFAERHHDLTSIARQYEAVFRFVLGRSEADSFRDVPSLRKARSL